jgi:glucosylceramidase
MVTAVKNPDGSIAVVVFNEGKIAKSFELKVGDILKNISISPQAIQTITLSNQAL